MESSDTVLNDVVILLNFTPAVRVCAGGLADARIAGIRWSAVNHLPGVRKHREQVLILGTSPGIALR